MRKERKVLSLSSVQLEIKGGWEVELQGHDLGVQVLEFGDYVVLFEQLLDSRVWVAEQFVEMRRVWIVVQYGPESRGIRGQIEKEYEDAIVYYLKI